VWGWSSASVFWLLGGREQCETWTGRDNFLMSRVGRKICSVTVWNLDSEVKKYLLYHMPSNEWFLWCECNFDRARDCVCELHIFISQCFSVFIWYKIFKYVKISTTLHILVSGTLTDCVFVHGILFHPQNNNNSKFNCNLFHNSDFSPLTITVTILFFFFVCFFQLQVYIS